MPLDHERHVLTCWTVVLTRPLEANDIVVVRAYYQWPTNPIFGALSLKNMNNGKRLIGSFAAFCNEPYQVGQSSSGGCG